MTAQAAEAVGATARGEVGVVRLGITPPAGPVIAPHLARHLAASRPAPSIEIQRMWLPALGTALQAGTIDAALTCGDLGIADPNITTTRSAPSSYSSACAPVTPSPPSRTSTCSV